MGIIIDKEKCTGCGACIEENPCNLIYLDEENKAYICDNRDCWDCMVCVKVCPELAIKTKLPYVLANYKAELVPVFNRERTEITWVLTDLGGNEEKFVIKTIEA